MNKITFNITIAVFAAGIASMSIGETRLADNKGLDVLKAQLGDKWQLVSDIMRQERIDSKMQELGNSLANVEENINSGNLNPEVAKSIKDHILLQRSFLQSRHLVVNRELITVPTISETASGIDDEDVLINKALKATSMHIQDGAKVVVDADEENYIVTFEYILPDRARGPDFAAKVFFNKETGVITKHIVAP